ncbi:MAG: alpha/beta hydrolase [Betaproteobacteria bacterium]|nr:alpha/beta hydrolase [Betaproteobacteria bacterium]
MAANENVVLVHGLWMHGVVLSWMARRIARSGYEVHTYSYPSVRMNLVQNVRLLTAFCQALDARPLNLVGHSLGGALIARMLDEPHRLEVGRVVFIGVPFTGSHAARRLARVRIGGAAMGATVADWFHGERPTHLADYDIGVIAGGRSVGLGMLVARDLPKPHDGTICVSETIVPDARDHIVLPVTHSQMVLSPLVVRQTCEFLRHGKFARGEAVS